MGVALFISVWVGRGGTAPHAGHAADEMLIMGPKIRRPHEGLVIKSGRQKLRYQAQATGYVPTQGGPVVLAVCGQILVELILCGADIRLGLGATAQPYQGIGFFTARPKHAPGAMVFKAAPHQAHPIGQKGRGQGVTVIALVGKAIEGEG